MPHPAPTTSSAIVMLLVALIALPLFAQEPSPAFGVKATLNANGTTLTLSLTGPAKGKFNAGMLQLEAPTGITATPHNPPLAQPDELYPDGLYPVGTTLVYQLTPPATSLKGFLFTFQGCVDEMCLLPETIPLEKDIAATAATTTPTGIVGTGALPLGVRTIAGYQSVKDFAQWLDGQSAQEENLLQRIANRYGLFLAALLVIPLGLLLNLTPCVLPMIPINLSIIGARAAGKGRRHGLILGGIYGGSMALSYGIAGGIFVLAGGRFGGLNANPWFNYAIAVIFAVLSLAMFDKVLIDFSRFRGAQVRFQRAWCTAALLGALSALLAGACVAPVLIWVLLLSSQLHAAGNPLAVWLPLLLGVGLGAPWPILGAGVACLPKPGKWMTKVKHAFGVIIIAMAAYYAVTATQLLMHSRQRQQLPDSAVAVNPQKAFQEALAIAQSSHKALFVEFGGISCKACATMKATTLKDPQIQERLSQMIQLEIDADDFDTPGLKPLLQQFQVAGLPTYVIVNPDEFRLEQ